MAQPKEPTSTLPNTSTPTQVIDVYTPQNQIDTGYGASYNHFANRIPILILTQLLLLMKQNTNKMPLYMSSP